jgi:hypothetical protein
LVASTRGGGDSRTSQQHRDAEPLFNLFCAYNERLRDENHHQLSFNCKLSRTPPLAQTSSNFCYVTRCWLQEDRLTQKIHLIFSSDRETMHHVLRLA